jgi:hypothetical protein
MAVMIKDVPFVYFTGESNSEYNGFAVDCEVGHEEYVVITSNTPGTPGQVGLAKVTRTPYGLAADMVVYDEFLRDFAELYPSFGGYSRETRNSLIQKAYLSEISLTPHHAHIGLHSAMVNPMGEYRWIPVESISI